jgi:hypothetical protein
MFPVWSCFLPDDDDDDEPQNGDVSDNDPSENNSKDERPHSKKRRSTLSKEAVATLRSWLWEHRFNAYPTEAEKRKLCEQCGLTMVQLCNWFINARRRTLPEMIRREGRDPARYTMSRRSGDGSSVHRHDDQLQTTEQALSEIATLHSNTTSPVPINYPLTFPLPSNSVTDSTRHDDGSGATVTYNSPPFLPLPRSLRTASGHHVPPSPVMFDPPPAYYLHYPTPMVVVPAAVPLPFTALCPPRMSLMNSGSATDQSRSLLSSSMQSGVRNSFQMLCDVALKEGGLANK